MKVVISFTFPVSNSLVASLTALKIRESMKKNKLVGTVEVKND